MNDKTEEYLKEEKGYDGLLATEEASRCLLCYDAPCSKACPAQTDPAKFIRSIRFQNFFGAITTIRINNPLGGICARVCPTEKYCASGCIRAGLDKPIDIGRLQRFATDLEKQTNFQVYSKPVLSKDKIAIVGSGPSGIACANVLAQNGYQVTIFEKNKKAGGYLTYGIPSYRLPQEVVDYEINKTLNLGVKILFQQQLGKNIALESLQKDFSAVILATGYEKCNLLSLFKDNPYVETAIDFLADLKTNPDKVSLPDDLLIIGGGDVAMDVATSSKKLGVKKVTVVARESMNDFPATRTSFDEAITNDVTIIPNFTPQNIKDSVVTFKELEGEGELTLTAKRIILATGQVSNIYSDTLSKDRNDYITKDYMTNVKGIFATGDIVKGDKTVVEAIKKGKECADKVIKYISKTEVL